MAGPEAARRDAPDDRGYAAVVFPFPLDREFDYRVPDALRGRLRTGSRVSVPLGPRSRRGYVVRLLDAPRHEAKATKDVARLLDEGEPLVAPDLLPLTRFVADYYGCSWGEALDAALPGPVRRRKTDPTSELCVVLRIGVAEAEKLAGALPVRYARRSQVLRLLASTGGFAPLSDLRRSGVLPAAASALATLKKEGTLAFESRPRAAVPLGPALAELAARPEPTPDQRAALDTILPAIGAGKAATFLLFGATGSGKTEIYLRAMEAAREKGLGSLILIPEISLTPQTLSRFRARARDVRVLHSHLSDQERLEEWRLLRQGRANVVVGARSAVFAPIPRLGLVVVDEEHEATYKQQNAPRYHARDLAVMRGALTNGVVILGSATPSLESWRNATSGKYGLVRLPHRVGLRELPPVEIVDRTQTKSEPGLPHSISRPLALAMKETLAAGRQAILFLNRRGHSSHLHCRVCGHVSSCARCDVGLTWHERIGRLVCHYCGREELKPAKCSACAMGAYTLAGAGTERLEKDVAALLPQAKAVRMDSDTMRTRGAHERALDAFGGGATDLLVGTQMIAKGLDFPNVALVGIVSADTSLSVPDFRAAERTFQLLTQVAGRAGRGEEPGRVILQTFHADHFCIATAAKHDFESFARRELEYRRKLAYPPYSKLARIVLAGKNDESVRRRAAEVRAAIDKEFAAERTEVEALGPAPCPVRKIQDRFRWHVLVKVKARELANLKRIVALSRPWTGAAAGGVRAVLDVDPTATM